MQRRASLFDDKSMSNFLKIHFSSHVEKSEESLKIKFIMPSLKRLGLSNDIKV